MPIDLKGVSFKLPPVELPAPIPPPILGSDWLGKLISPLHAPAFSQEGVSEIADRVKYIGLAAIAVVVAMVIRLAYSKVYPTDATGKAEEKDKGGDKPKPAPVSTRKPPESTRAMLKDGEVSIQKDFENLHGHCEMLSDDLFGVNRIAKEAREAALDRFAGHLSEFEKYYQASRKDKANSNLFNDLSKVKTNFLHMSDIANGIIRVPGDGNCLFYCISEAMDAMSKTHVLSGVWKPEWKNDQALREHIVKEMRKDLNQDPNLKKEIDGAITRFIQDKKDKTIPSLQSDLALFRSERNVEKEAETVLALKTLEADLEQLKGANKYDFYFEKVNQPRFFAGDAEIYEAAKIFNVGFTVQREHEGKVIEGFETIVNEKAPLQITLLYRNDDHFDWQPEVAT